MNLKTLEVKKNESLPKRDLEQILTINIEKIPCYASIGVDPEEKKMGQELLIDVSVNISSEKLHKTDNIKDTVSYVDIFKTIQTVGKSKSYSLIETLAEDIVQNLLNYPQVLSVKLKVHKPHIPYKDFHGNVSVFIERKK